MCGLTRPQDHQGLAVEDEVEDMVQGMTPEGFAAELSAGLADVGAVRLENGGCDSFASLSSGDLEEEQQDRVVLGVMTGAPGAISTLLLYITPVMANKVREWSEYSVQRKT